ncbi:MULTISPECIES: hypothetical protein [unclassified Microbacterium]|uniref:hypothetical protein n=1 Tax=unclassified Microbacterium TaxID=2609290 RepID=UPI003015ED70
MQDKTIVSCELANVRAELREILDDRASILRSWGFAAPDRELTQAATAGPATASRVRAVAHGEEAPVESSGTEPLPGTPEVTAPSVIDFPVVAPGADPTPETDSEELSA